MLPGMTLAMRPLTTVYPRTLMTNTTRTAIARRRQAQLTHWFTATQQRQMSSAHGTATSAEEAQAEVIHRQHLGAREIILNRQKKLNALNLPMVESMLPKIQSWEKSELAYVMVLKSNGGKGFCAGGDIKTVVDLARANDPGATVFFEKEYQLDHYISTLDTPFVSVMNGITMGGGVGLSVHAPFRVATENTLFAMPETAIGFFPDVGGSFFLPRLDGQLGTYLGLTGKRLKGSDVLYAGIATHYVPSSRLSDLEARLAELDQPNHDVVNQAIEDFSAEMDQEASFSLGGDIRAAIDRCFKYDTVQDIVSALKKEDSAWAKETLDLLDKMSPTSLKVTLQQLRSGASLSIAQCFKMEYHLVQHFLQGHDFDEGVTSMLVTRTAAAWKPASLDQVKESDIKKLYFDMATPQRLSLLSNKDYKQYPHRKYALPSEEDVKRVVTGEVPDVGNYALSQDEVVQYMVRDRRGKQGVKNKVLEVLQRKTTVNANDTTQSLKWVY